MKTMWKILWFVTPVLFFLNFIVFYGSVVDLFNQWMWRGFAYIAATLLFPVFLPALAFNPWFDAWMSGLESPDPVVMFFWVALIVCIFFWFVLGKISSKNQSKSK